VKKRGDERSVGDHVIGNDYQRYVTGRGGGSLTTRLEEDSSHENVTTRIRSEMLVKQGK
jgi:hypothetical protein